MHILHAQSYLSNSSSAVPIFISIDLIEAPESFLEARRSRESRSSKALQQGIMLRYKMCLLFLVIPRDSAYSEAREMTYCKSTTKNVTLNIRQRYWMQIFHSQHQKHIVLPVQTLLYLATELLYFNEACISKATKEC